MDIQNFHEDIKSVFKPVTDSFKQTAQKTIGAVNDMTKEIEQQREETLKAFNEFEDLTKIAINFDLRVLKPLGEVANSKNTSQFRLRVNPISMTLYIKKNVPIAFYGKSLIFTDSFEKFDFESEFLDMMTNFKINALFKEQPKDNNLLLDYLDETTFDLKHAGDKKTRDESFVK